MLTAGDEYFLTCYGITAVALNFGLGAHDAEISSCMRFRQSHGAGPLAGIKLRQILAFLLVRAVGINTQTGTHRQRAIQVQTAVG